MSGNRRWRRALGGGVSALKTATSEARTIAGRWGRSGGERRKGGRATIFSPWLWCKQVKEPWRRAQADQQERSR
jgi:hypothetical protein